MNPPGAPSTTRPAPRADALLAPLESGGVRFELGKFRQLLDHLDRPQQRFPAVLVAGTNGKGSTSAFLTSILDAAGYRVGLYTSPHLETVLERVRVGGRTVSDLDLSRALERVFAAASPGRPPTHFEALTAAAFLHFAEAALDIAVVEVGLGGRLDATNVVEPVLAVVTPIGLDHQEYLGSTIAEIATEKAGIFRRGVPSLVARMRPEARTALARVADEVGAIHEELAVDPEFERTVTPGLTGVHQLDNARLAARAAQILAQRGFPAVDAAAIRKGLERCRWPGRLERVEWAGGVVWFDGAHNADGAATLADHLRRSGLPFDLLVGALVDKSPADWLPVLAGAARRAWATTVSSSRAAPAAAVAAWVAPAMNSGGACIAIDEPKAALRDALARSNHLVVTGSLYLVGELRGALRAQVGAPAPTWESSLFAE